MLRFLQRKAEAVTFSNLDKSGTRRSRSNTIQTEDRNKVPRVGYEFRASSDVGPASNKHGSLLLVNRTPEAVASTKRESLPGR